MDGAQALVIAGGDGVPLRVLKDTNSDKYPDVFEYYENGVLVKREQDLYPDEKRHIDTWTHFRNGMEHTMKQDYDNDGIINETTIYTDGVISKQEIDQDEDGNIEEYRYYERDCGV